MKTILASAACLALVQSAVTVEAVPCSKGVLAARASCVGEPYDWMISASTTDPYVNTTSATFGVATYYLWFSCCTPLPGGMAAAEFDIVSTGVLHVASIPVNGFLNAGTVDAPLLAVGGCPCGPMIAMHLVVIDLPGSMCLAPSALNGIKGTVDCSASPQLYGIDWIGLEVLGPVSVEESSFGGVKSLYRR